MNNRIQNYINAIRALEADIVSFRKNSREYGQRSRYGVSTSDIQDKVSDIERMKVQLANLILKEK